jgi:hypothetical protein
MGAVEDWFMKQKAGKVKNLNSKTRRLGDSFSGGGGAGQWRIAVLRLRGRAGMGFTVQRENIKIDPFLTKAHLARHGTSRKTSRLICNTASLEIANYTLVFTLLTTSPFIKLHSPLSGDFEEFLLATKAHKRTQKKRFLNFSHSCFPQSHRGNTERLFIVPLCEFFSFPRKSLFSFSLCFLCASVALCETFALTTKKHKRKRNKFSLKDTEIQRLMESFPKPTIPIILFVHELHELTRTCFFCVLSCAFVAKNFFLCFAFFPSSRLCVFVPSWENFRFGWKGRTRRSAPTCFRVLCGNLFRFLLCSFVRFRG